MSPLPSGNNFESPDLSGSQSDFPSLPGALSNDSSSTGDHEIFGLHENAEVLGHEPGQLQCVDGEASNGLKEGSSFNGGPNTTDSSFDSSGGKFSA